jgi:hypothetical protein
VQLKTAQLPPQQATNFVAVAMCLRHTFFILLCFFDIAFRDYFFSFLQLRCNGLLSWLSATQFFCPFFLFLFLPLFFVCLWQSVCFLCCDLQANIYKHYRHFILQQSCKYFAPFCSCKARAIKFLCCPPKSDKLHFFCPFFLFEFYSKAVKDFILLVVWRCHFTIFFAPFFFTASLCNVFFIATGRNIFLPLFFFVVPLALHFLPLFSFSFLPLFSSAVGSRFVFILVFKDCFLTSFLFSVVVFWFYVLVQFWGLFLGFGLGSVLVLLFVFWWWFWFGFFVFASCLKSLVEWGF